MNVFSDLIDKFLFASGLLLGAQLPNFLAQYKQRLAGHADEAAMQLRDYTTLAEKYHSGDMTALINAHLENDSPLFRAEGELIQKLVDRSAYLADRVAALSGDLATIVEDVVLHLDYTIAEATLRELTYAFPLTTGTLVCGASLALLFSYIPRVSWFVVVNTGKVFSRRGDT